MASLLLLLKHLLSLHQLALLLLLHLILLKLLQVHSSLFWIHTGEHLFLLLGQVELYGVPLKLYLLPPWTPPSPWVGQQKVSFSQILLLLRRGHLRELLSLLHADPLDMLLNDLLLSLHVWSHWTCRNLILGV